MNKRILEILTFVMKEIQQNFFDDVDLEFLMNILSERGFSDDEIQSAMGWLMNHGDKLDISYKNKNSGIPRPLWRHLNEMEHSAISSEAFSYLFHLRELNLLSDDDMETIIDRAVNLHVPQMDIEDMQDLIAVVVLDFENSASNGYFQFTSTGLRH